MKLALAAHFQNGRVESQFGPSPIFTSSPGEIATPWGTGGTHPVGDNVPRFRGLPWRQNMVDSPVDLSAPEWSTVHPAVPVVQQGVEGWSFTPFDQGNNAQIFQTTTVETVAGQAYRLFVLLGCPEADIGNQVRLFLSLEAPDSIDVTLDRAIGWYATPLSLPQTVPQGAFVALRNDPAGTSVTTLHVFAVAVVAVQDMGNFEKAAPSSLPLETLAGSFDGGKLRWSVADRAGGQVDINGSPLADVSTMTVDFYSRPFVKSAPSCGAVEV